MTLTGADIIIAKLSDDGTMLEGSTFMGGTEHLTGSTWLLATQYNYGDHSRGEIVVDAADNIFTWLLPPVLMISDNSRFPLTTVIMAARRRGFLSQPRPQ